MSITKPVLPAPSGQTGEIAILAKALGHPARVQIILTLMRQKTCIGCDLTDATGLAASTTSEHLRILKQAGIVVGEIERPRVCYSLNPDALAPLQAFLMTIAKHPAPPLEVQS